MTSSELRAPGDVLRHLRRARDHADRSYTRPLDLDERAGVVPLEVPLHAASTDAVAQREDSVMFTIHRRPNLSVHMPNVSPHTCLSSGISMSLPTESLSQ
jgi:hypothetical protein